MTVNKLVYRGEWFQIGGTLDPPLYKKRVLAHKVCMSNRQYISFFVCLFNFGILRNRLKSTSATLIHKTDLLVAKLHYHYVVQSPATRTDVDTNADLWTDKYTIVSKALRFLG